MMTDAFPTVDECLRVHGELSAAEIADFVHHCHNLDARLRSFEPGAVVLDLYVKERSQPSQHVTFEAKIARWPALVATTTDADLDRALLHVRDELIRQITDAKSRREPRHDRRSSSPKRGGLTQG
jgi:ribosome-associated translation inhibitor RaiA